MAVATFYEVRLCHNKYKPIYYKDACVHKRKCRVTRARGVGTTATCVHQSSNMRGVWRRCMTALDCAGRSKDLWQGRTDNRECASASVTVLSVASCKKWSGRLRAYTSDSPRLIRLWGRVRGHTMVTGSANTCWLPDVLDSVDFK